MHIPSFSFTKQTNRISDLFGPVESSRAYDAKKELTMVRLAAGIPDIKKVKSRNDGLSLSCTDFSCLNTDKVVEAKT